MALARPVRAPWAPRAPAPVRASGCRGARRGSFRPAGRSAFARWRTYGSTHAPNDEGARCNPAVLESARQPTQRPTKGQWAASSLRYRDFQSTAPGNTAQRFAYDADDQSWSNPAESGHRQDHGRQSRSSTNDPYEQSFARSEPLERQTFEQKRYCCHRSSATGISSKRIHA